MTETCANPLITTDVPCVGCGYSLKGRPNQGRCPECGAPVRSSTSPGRLFVGRPRWYDHLLWFVVVIGAALGLAALFLGWVLREPLVFRISIRVSQTAFLVALFGAPFSYSLRHSWLVRISALLALATAIVAVLAV